MAYVWFVVVSLIWGSSFILMKKAAVVFEPMTIGAWRVLGGAVVLGLMLGVAWLRRRAIEGDTSRGGNVPRFSWSGLGALLVVVGLGFVYPFSMQPYLIGKLGQSGFIGMMVGLVPLLTIAASAVLLSSWPGWRQWVGVLMGLACMPVLFGVGRDLGVGAADVALAATVPLGYAISNTWVKRRLSGWSPMALTASACGLACLVLVPIGVVESSDTAGLSGLADRRWWPTAWPTGMTAALGGVLVLGVVGTGVATVLFYRMIQQRGPLFAGMVTYVVPAEALLWGMWDGERVTAWQVIALGVILLSVAMVQWPARAANESSHGD